MSLVIMVILTCLRVVKLTLTSKALILIDFVVFWLCDVEIYVRLTAIKANDFLRSFYPGDSQRIYTFLIPNHHDRPFFRFYKLSKIGHSTLFFLAEFLA